MPCMTKKSQYNTSEQKNDLVLFQMTGKRISLDIETTGLNFQSEKFPDEILQVSIIDGEGQCLLNRYFKPYHHKSWPDAEKINHISPEMVANAPYLHEIAPQIKRILQSAETIIGYNIVGFDLPFIEQAIGPLALTANIIDVMELFSPIYGEWDESRNTYKRKSLVACSEYFGIDFTPHNALEDARATLKCFDAITNYSQNHCE